MQYYLIIILFIYYNFFFTLLQELDEKINTIENAVQGNYQVMFNFHVIVSNIITCICFTFIQELTKKVDQNVKDIQVKKEKHQVIFLNFTL